MRKYILILLIFFFSSSFQVYGQMFSVQSNNERSASTIPLNNVMGFVDIAEFNYFGSMSESTEIPNDIYNFSGNLYGARYESPMLQLYAAFGSSLGEENDVRATLIGATLESLYPILRREKINISIPFMLITDYTLIRTNETANSSAEFSQSAVYFGSGIILSVRPAQKLRIVSKSIPAIGYSTGSLGAGGGASYKLHQQFRVYADRLVRQVGFTAGVDLRFSRFDSNNERFKYDYSSISIVAGFTF